MREAKVSIVTPNYNYGHYISETIESILSQDYGNIEHIIVDDGSTDNSVEIVQGYIAKFPHRIKLIVQENKGQSAALNVGFKKAEGQIIGWLNSDDSFCPGAIMQIVDAFDKHPGVDMVFGDLLIINENSEVINRRKQLPVNKLTGSLLGFAQIVASNTLFWKSAIFPKVGYINESFKYNMDGDFFAKLFRNGKSLHIQKDIARFRVHTNKTTLLISPEKQNRYNNEMLDEIKSSCNRYRLARILGFQTFYLLRFPIRGQRVITRLVNRHYF